MFVQDIHSIGSTKSKLHISNIISSIIDEVGAKNLVQIVMDNEKNYQQAGKILKQRYPHVYPCGCNIYSLNIVLKDWY